MSNVVLTLMVKLLMTGLDIQSLSLRMAVS
jgi:hypothetical protein